MAGQIVSAAHGASMGPEPTTWGYGGRKGKAMMVTTADTPHLHGAVVHVRDLDRSVAFYAALFALEVAQREANAVV